MKVDNWLASIVPEFQARLRAYAFSPELEDQAAELQSHLSRHRSERADPADPLRLKALAVLAEYLDAFGRANEAATLLKPTVRELLDGLADWPDELRTAPAGSLHGVRRLLRQRVWCCAAYAVCLIRSNRLTAAADILVRLLRFVDAHLRNPAEFPCHGTAALLHYYQGVLHRNRGLLNEAALDFDVALEQVNLRWQEKQAKHGAQDPDRLRRESIYHRVNTARILGFGHGAIALSRGRYVEARAWTSAAQQILAQSGQEMWRRSLEVYGCCASVLLQDLAASRQALLTSHARRLRELAVWFGERNRRNGTIAEAFALLAEVRLRQIATLVQGGSLLDALDLSGLRARIDNCLKEIPRDAGPLSAPAALRLIGCLLRARQYKRSETELQRFQKALGLHEDYAAEFQTMQAELWLETGRAAAARALLTELVEQRPANRAFRARAWALLAWCEQRHGQVIWANRALAAARESLDHVQDGFTKVLVTEIAQRLGQSREPFRGAMPYQAPEDDARWSDLDHNLDMARLNVVEAVRRRHPDCSVAKLAALLGRGHSWLYAFLASHRDVEWVGRILKAETRGRPAG